jgi:hypothetical protein
MPDNPGHLPVLIKLTLRALPDRTPAVNRLRAALKRLLRSYGFVCTRIEPASALEAVGAEQSPGSEVGGPAPYADPP